MSLTWTHPLTRNCSTTFPNLRESTCRPSLTLRSPFSTHSRSVPSAMGVLSRRRRRLFTALAFLIFASSSASAVSPALQPRHCGKSAKTHNTHLTQSRFFFPFPWRHAGLVEVGEERKRGSGLQPFERILTQGRRGGPGSSPPSCRSKCRSCTPCKAVHVPIQPGFSFPLEYYPEAWRCKCGNKLFVP